MAPVAEYLKRPQFRAVARPRVEAEPMIIHTPLCSPLVTPLEGPPAATSLNPVDNSQPPVVVDDGLGVLRARVTCQSR